MLETSSTVVAARLQKASNVIAVVAFVVGAGVLATWVWSLPGLSRIHPVLGGMGAHAAFGFMCVSTSLLLLHAPVSIPRRIAATVLAAAVAAMAVTTISGWAAVSLGGLLPGRMPTASAEVFLGFAIALLTLDVQLGRFRPAEFCSFASALVALFALVAYTLGSFSVVASVNVRPLAFHSVLLMAAFAFALLAARPRGGLMSLVISDTVAGVMVRRMLPAVIGIPVVVAWLTTEAQRAELVPAVLAVPYYAVAIVIVFATMTWRVAGSIHRIDVQRVEAQQQVQDLNAELEQRVADRTAELARVNSELEAFSYSVSHDLRAPLRHIDGFSQMLATRHSDTLDETGRRHIAVIREGAQNMGKMIDDLLSLARLDRQSVVREQSDLNAIVRKVAQDLQHEIGVRRVEWSIETLPSAECDPGLITLVFTNLLSNAVKYSSKREVARISVSARTSDEGVVFAVSDNGAGFDQAYQDKLFGVFQRLHRADEFEGTGIGLATVRRIIHKHGGRIWAEAAVDRGATFYFTLGPTNLTNPTNLTTRTNSKAARETPSAWSFRRPSVR